MSVSHAQRSSNRAGDALLPYELPSWPREDPVGDREADRASVPEVGVEPTRASRRCKVLGLARATIHVTQRGMAGSAQGVEYRLYKLFSGQFTPTARRCILHMRCFQGGSVIRDQDWQDATPQQHSPFAHRTAEASEQRRP